jgi:hypothetical protein
MTESKPSIIFFLEEKLKGLKGKTCEMNLPLLKKRYHRIFKISKTCRTTAMH